MFDFFVVAMGGLEWGGENKIPADSMSDVFGSLTQRPEQMGTAFWDGVNLAQIHIQSTENIPLNLQQILVKISHSMWVMVKNHILIRPSLNSWHKADMDV